MDDCAEKCQQDRNCAAFTFDNESKGCRLKAACPTLSDSGVVSGIRKSGVKFPTFLEGVGCKDKTIGVRPHFDGSLDLCVGMAKNV